MIADRSNNHGKSRGARTAVTALLVFFGCYVGARVGTAVVFPGVGTAVIFPPYAVLAAALILSPAREWWLYVLASAAGNFWPHMQHEGLTSFVLIAEVANVTRGFVAALGVRWCNQRGGHFDSLHGTVMFLIFAVVVGPALGALIGALAVISHNPTAEFSVVWLAWLLSNMLTGLTLLPLLLVIFTRTRNWNGQVPLRRSIEATVLVIGLLGVGGYILAGPVPRGVAPARLFLPLPLLLWAAVRFGPGGMVAALSVVSALTIAGALNGRGPFATHNPAEDLLQLQSFLITLCAPLMVVAAIVRQQTQTATALRESQAELREDRQQMELAAAAAELGSWRWDIVGDTIWMSETGRALFGLEGSEPISLERLMKVLHPDDQQTFMHSFANSMNGIGDYECEFRVPLRDGQLRWILGHGRVEFTGRGKPDVVRGVVLDVTRRKQAEERFRLVFDSAPNAMIVVDSAGIITLANRQTEAVFGYARHELIGQAIETLIPERFGSVHEGYRSNYLLAPQARAMGAGRELFGKRKDGSEVPVEIGLNPIQTSEGTLILAAVIDITERRKVECEQVRHRSELTHLARVAMLGELSGSLAHELNQPLTAILSNTQAAQEFLAQDSTDLDELREILQDIVQEDRRAREVIRRLGLLFRKGEIQFEAIDLNELVIEVLTLMNHDLINHGLRVQMDLATFLPHVKGDRIHLQQVLINLILNASDAMTDNQDSDRELRMTTVLDENGDVRISVADTGCGIATEEMDQIFKPFHTTKKNGMGLGLAVCRTIVSAHAGRLWATSNRDRGACFHVSFSPMAAGTT